MTGDVCDRKSPCMKWPVFCFWAGYGALGLTRSYHESCYKGSLQEFRVKEFEVLGMVIPGDTVQIS